MNSKYEEQFYQAFCSQVKPRLEAEGFTVSQTVVYKNNDVFRAFSVMPEGKHVAAMLYPNDFANVMEDGASMAQALELSYRYAHVASTGIPDGMRERYLSEIKPENLRVAIVNYERNKSWIDDLPHAKVKDLALYAKVEVGEKMSTRVTAQVMDKLKMTKEELIVTALQNTEAMAKVDNIGNVLQSIMGEVDAEMIHEFPLIQEPPIYVLTTKDGANGAALLASKKVLRSVREMLGDDFYILPSSIHETLLIAKNQYFMGVDELEGMVRTINKNEVALEDQLSNNVYLFDGKLKMAREVEEKLEMKPFGENEQVEFPMMTKPFARKGV